MWKKHIALIFYPAFPSEREGELDIYVVVSAQIASDYGNDPSITSILDTMDIFLLPVTNPDGYVFSQTKVSLDFFSPHNKSLRRCVGTLKTK